MLLYTVLVMNAVCGKENANSAFLFCKNLMQYKNYGIKSIFFYGDGVLHANNMVNKEFNSLNLVHAWCALSKKFNISLNLCSKSAQERGIITDDMARELGFLNGNINKYFNITGLGELFFSIMNTDRLIQF